MNFSPKKSKRKKTKNRINKQKVGNKPTFLMVYLYVEKIPQFYWGLKKALAKTEKAGKRPPKNVEEKLNLQV